MRSFKHQLPATAAKAAWLRKGLFTDYAHAANELAKDLNNQWLHYFTTLKKEDRPMPLMSSVPDHIKTAATTTVAQQAYANSAYPSMTSKVGNVVNDVRLEINSLRNSEQPPDANTLKQLYYINKSRKWLNPEGLSNEWLAWLKDSFNKHWTRRSTPTFKDNVIYLDQRNCKRQEAKSSRRFELWLRITHKHEGVTVPVKTNSYADTKAGEARGLFRIGYNADKHRLEADFIKKLDFADQVDAYTKASDSLDKTIAIDFGLTSIITTQAGSRYGNSLMNYIVKMDAKIQHIASQCQKRGFRLSRSKRYRTHVKRLRTTIDRTINEALNEMVDQDHPAIIVAEKLDFREQHLSRRMNRLVGNCGRAAVTAKLNALLQECGIDFIEVNPAYTSQTCSSCGYVDKKNRVSRDTFRCRWCAHEDCADTNAAANILTRRSWQKWWLTAHRRAVLNRAVAEFVQTNSKNGVLACTSEQAATISDNPYFKGSGVTEREGCGAEVDHERGGGEKGVTALSTLKCK